MGLNGLLLLFLFSLSNPELIWVGSFTFISSKRLQINTNASNT